jgi:dipeptidase E
MLPMAEHLGKIVAMGGGGFSMDADNPLLDDFVLSLSHRQPPRVCFVPTASSDSPQYLTRFTGQSRLAALPRT